MEDTGAASRGRLPRAGRGGRRCGGGRRWEDGAGRPAGRRPLRAAQGERRGGPNNQVAMKSDQSARLPPREDRVCVVVPKDFNHGRSTLLWALLNVANNGERLFIVHVHRWSVHRPHLHKRISFKEPEIKKKLGEYVSMCNERKVRCDLEIRKTYDVAKELAKLIDRHGITKLVMRGAAGERYSKEMKSLKFKTAIKLKETAPLTCKIWFTCDMQLICTREANATVPAIQRPPVPAATVNTEVSKDEIEESIKCLDNTLIGKGGSGSVYKGRFRNTDVAIKKLHRESMQDESDFIRKVGVLGRVRHPNLVTLMGVCREVFGLVYEFLPNGSLQDRLACRNGVSSLKWQVRMKIIHEIWTVLTFLHLSKPPLVHGNLKPSKVLILDNNLACKLEAFGISQSNGKATTTQHDDVHSLGTIVLQLLTGLPPENIAKVVEEAMTEKKLHKILDATAGNWPIAVANQLALIGLRCVRMSGEERPDLAGDVRKLLVAADELAAASQDEAQAPRPPTPDHFKCPISKEVMVDPHIASDGHTYELKDISSWFSCGGNHRYTSPLTRETLPDNKLIQNRLVKSIIMDWREKDKEQRRQQSQVRTLTVCDPNPVQSSLQGHPTIPPGSRETSRTRGKLKID